MSRVDTAACPLLDCTLAVDNAENIRHSNGAKLLGLKLGAETADLVTPSVRFVVRAAKNEKAPSARRARAAKAPQTSAETTTTPEKRRPSALDAHVFAKPFTPTVSPLHNDPYAACLLNSPYTPEDSFYACYAETEAESASVLHTPVRTRTVGQKSPIGETTRTLLEMLQLTPCKTSSPHATPAKAAGTNSDRAVSHGALSSPAASANAASTLNTPNRAASPLQPAATRVVRKVVSCGVDRTSGRPVPKPKAE